MKSLLVTLLFACTASASFAAQFNIEGIYDGKNIFINNPQRTMDTWCAYSVSLNGKEVIVGSLGASFEIDLAKEGLKLGEAYVIVILHHDDCSPEIIKPMNEEPSSEIPQINVEGTYQGKNVFVSNPLRNDGSFCTVSVYVNGRRLADTPTGSSYEINLTSMGFTIGETIRIVIVHHEDCAPFILSDTFYTPVIRP